MIRITELKFKTWGFKRIFELIIAFLFQEQQLKVLSICDSKNKSQEMW